MINHFLFFYRNYNYLYYGLSIYYTLSISYNTYYYCNLAYNYIPLSNNNKHIELVMSEINNNDINEKWTLIEKKLI